MHRTGAHWPRFRLAPQESTLFNACPDGLSACSPKLPVIEFSASQPSGRGRSQPFRYERQSVSQSVIVYAHLVMDGCVYGRVHRDVAIYVLDETYSGSENDAKLFKL
eukprot:scaffold99686_cov28-Prasinocladus_malaysianus.AAC.1